MDQYFNFTGFLYNRRIIQQLLEKADICLETAPYNEINCKSTFIKVMEYMAAGKPIVAFDLDETRYSAQASALLIEPGNLKAFAKAIEMLICDPSKRETLGKYGQDRIRTLLHWNNSSKELLRAYEHVLQANVPRIG
jgi:glycosyltransferase involved in cell wall biosynthesis